ncbi:universal stress protein [Phytohabitans rumicis]|uniref:Universal stress protein UspA n=1 Tax=Phytohabitans rumicis TaxID=1076125 RepID=A0A6V8LHF9_9ACTN|nr:universal stress protein [Phytohabitans rumicis]GFJ96672.1 universal stress protein UspA [Phytohabitans rumicis]
MGPTILVGLGGSGGWQALAWAVDEATATGGRLVICHAAAPDNPLALRVPTPPLAVLELFDPPLARAVASTRRRLGSDRVTLQVLPGRPGPLLASAAARADLVVIGSPARHRPGGYGSTAHHVAARAPGPLVVVRPITAGPDAPMLGHVVVGVDDSGDCDAALDFAFDWADRHRCVLAAVHVATQHREDYWFDQTTLSTHFSAMPAGLELLSGQVEPWMHKYPQVPVKCAVFGGRPVPGLMRAAHGARLLVVGDHGRGRLGPAGRIVLGSVAHGVLDHATGPVAVVRQAPRQGEPK